jgi:protein associated with RNAse G/E
VSEIVPGTPVRCETSKWGDRPHWQYDGVFLGTDEHGDWIGAPAGTHHQRPGHAFVSRVDTVTVFPPGSWWAATFQAPGIWCEVYVDVATPGTWDGDVMRCVDLDLDVVRMSPVLPGSVPPGLAGAGAGATVVDDEDEFAEHQVAFGYPADVVAAAQSACDALVVAVRDRHAPFDGAHQRWLDDLAAFTRA